eukprot:TRINITY_DN3401_c0_g1_i3.p1 TRINITY_DN3401_c0_g1~~TRINITY_DN3401_c0_g1_i3.p1  ORF type:complete len:193 (+),score=12.53 TRINITY_DN3401_c0_g1_i3:285-863(+)
MSNKIVAHDWLAFSAFAQRKEYKFLFDCLLCNIITLDCGCEWTHIGKIMKFTIKDNDIDCDTCMNEHPMTPIDISLINDYTSFCVVSFIFRDIVCKKMHKPFDDELILIFLYNLWEEEEADIVWTLNDIIILEYLYNVGSSLGAKEGRVIGEVLKTNRILKKIDFRHDEVKDEDVEALCEGLKATLSFHYNS